LWSICICQPCLCLPARCTLAMAAVCDEAWRLVRATILWQTAQSCMCSVLHAHAVVIVCAATDIPYPSRVQQRHVRAGYTCFVFRQLAVRMQQTNLAGSADAASCACRHCFQCMHIARRYTHCMELTHCKPCNVLLEAVVDRAAQKGPAIPACGSC
jgi:hypothetical protein